MTGVENKNLLEVNHVKTYYKGRNKKEVVRAVDDVSFTISEGETLGLVGESVCGKSSLGRTILRLQPAAGGEVLYKGQDILKYPEKDMRNLRRKMQLVFQNPYAALNPRMTVLESVRAPLDIFHIGSRKERYEKSREILKYIGLDSHQINRYPHEFSGGQRQRVVIARAMITQPDFIVCDEPVSALDVSVRAQVLNLMQDLQKERKVAYLFISHDLSVVKHISDRIAVMYLGKIVELASRDDLYQHPKHPYTEALLSAIPIPDANDHPKRIILQGDMPSPLNPPEGCRFHTRCRYAMECCKTEQPEFVFDRDGHGTACHLYRKEEHDGKPDGKDQ